MKKVDVKELLNLLVMKYSTYKYEILLIGLLGLSIQFSVCLNNRGINPELKEYISFVDDVLNIISILTGFLSTLICLVLALPNNSRTLNVILEDKQLKRQYVWSMFVPFILGLVSIIEILYLKVYFNNSDKFFDFFGQLNIIFLGTAIFFLETSILMIIIAVKIALKNQEGKRETETNVETVKDLKVKKDKIYT